MVVAFWHDVLQELQKLRHKQKLGCMRRAEPERSVNLPTLLPLYHFTAELVSGVVTYTKPTMVVAFWIAKVAPRVTVVVGYCTAGALA
jgi:hypothetical protein